MTIEPVTLTGADQYSAPITVIDSPVSISIRGLSQTGTIVQLERKRVGEDDTEYRVVKKYTEDVEDVGFSATEWVWRIGCTEGGYRKGTINAEIGG